MMEKLLTDPWPEKVIGVDQYERMDHNNYHLLHEGSLRQIEALQARIEANQSMGMLVSAAAFTMGAISGTVVCLILNWIF